MNYVPNWMKNPPRQSNQIDAANQNCQSGILRLRNAPEGARNMVLNETAFKLYRAEAVFGEPLTAVREQIKQTALERGLPIAEVEHTMESARQGALRSGIQGLESNSSADTLPFISATPYVPQDPSTIPRRQFIFNNHYIRKYVSATAAPGGVGKSALSLLESTFMASGMVLPGIQTGTEPRYKVWVFNLEDPLEELQRRVEAIRLYYEIPEADIVGNLFLDSGREQELIIAKQERGGTIVTPRIRENLVAEIRKNEIDVLVIDPFISSHSVSENDNSGIDLVVKEWGKIADEGNISVELIHHTRKETEGARLGAESFRGGKSFIDGVRHARILEPMDEGAAASYGIVNPRAYFKVETVKANLSPGSSSSECYEMMSVELGNGDSVGVPVSRSPQKQFLEPSEEQMEDILQKLAGGEFRQHDTASEWAGKIVAEVMNLDFGPGLSKKNRSPSQNVTRKQIISLLKHLESEGTLMVKVQPVNGDDKKFLVTNPEALTTLEGELEENSD